MNLPFTVNRFPADLGFFPIGGLRESFRRSLSNPIEFRGPGSVRIKNPQTYYAAILIILQLLHPYRLHLFCASRKKDIGPGRTGQVPALILLPELPGVIMFYFARHYYSRFGLAPAAGCRALSGLMSLFKALTRLASVFTVVEQDDCLPRFGYNCLSKESGV